MKRVVEDVHLYDKVSARVDHGPIVKKAMPQIDYTEVVPP
jgi:hypothetical protein